MSKGEKSASETGSEFLSRLIVLTYGTDFGGTGKLSFVGCLVLSALIDTLIRTGTRIVVVRVLV